MNPTRRLLDEGSGDPELLRLLRTARAPKPLDSATFERSRARVFALGSMPAAIGVLVLFKHAALGAVLGGTVAVAATAPRWLGANEAVAPAPSASVRSTRPAPTVAPSAKPVIVAPPPVASSDQVREPPPAADAGISLSREIALLEAARAELGRRPGAALALLARHEAEFPGGTLAVEREFLTVSALERLGRRPEAEARAKALRARAPKSLYEQRLDQLFEDAGGAP
jgi:hypothetical protein